MNLPISLQSSHLLPATLQLSAQPLYKAVVVAVIVVVVVVVYRTGHTHTHTPHAFTNL